MEPVHLYLKHFYITKVPQNGRTACQTVSLSLAASWIPPTWWPAPADPGTEACFPVLGWWARGRRKTAAAEAWPGPNLDHEDSPRLWAAVICISLSISALSSHIYTPLRLMSRASCLECDSRLARMYMTTWSCVCSEMSRPLMSRIRSPSCSLGSDRPA